MAHSCPLHPGNVIGGIAQPNPEDGSMPGQDTGQPEGEAPPPEGTVPEGEIAG